MMSLHLRLGLLKNMKILSKYIVFWGLTVCINMFCGWVICFTKVKLVTFLWSIWCQNLKGTYTRKLMLLKEKKCCIFFKFLGFPVPITLFDHCSSLASQCSLLFWYHGKFCSVKSMRKIWTVISSHLTGNIVWAD